MPTKNQKKVRRNSDAIDENLTTGLEVLLPFLRKMLIVPETADTLMIRDSDLKELAAKWNVPLYDVKSGHILTFAELIKTLKGVAERIAIRRLEDRAQQRQKKESRREEVGAGVW